MEVTPRRIRIAPIAAALALSSLSVAAGCALFGGGHPEGANPENEHWLRQLVVHTIHVRRPEGTPVDLKAYPWDAGYRASPRPDARFNCAPMGAMSAGFDLAAVRSCLKSIQPGTSVTYKLVRGPRPELLLEGIPEPKPSPSPEPAPSPGSSPKPSPSPEPPPVPPCLVKVLPRVPVPREIVYQSAEEGRIMCYSSRVEDSTGLGADLVEAFSTNRVVLRLNFPVWPMPDSDLKTAQWLVSLSLSPFLREQGILGRILPDSQCQACLGEEVFVKPWEPVPLTWPHGTVPQGTLPQDLPPASSIPEMDVLDE